MKEILITGVSGLMGSRMAHWILENHETYNVIGVDNLSGGQQEFIPEGVEFIRADLAYESLDSLVGNRPVDYVFHFAAYAAEGLSPFIRKYNYSNNLVATANVVNYCINQSVKRLVFTSSMAVYGKGMPPFDESHVPQPIDPYGIAKYACEMDIQVANQQHGLDFCIIRPHNVYGINQNIWDRYRNVLGIWMFQKLNGQPFSIFGEGKQKRAFSYIDDSLEPLWNAANLPETRNEIINLGGIKEVTIAEAAELLAEVVGGADVEYLSPRHEVMNAFSTYEKSVALLGYQDRTDLRTGLAKMWQWVLTLPKRERFEWENYEIDRGLYDFWRRR